MKSMGIYSERLPSFWQGFLILFFSFVLIYGLWMTPARELFRQEGVFAAIAAEYADNLWNPADGITAKAHNVMLSDAWPLYPAVVSLFYRFMPMESALRLVSVVMLGSLSLLSGITAALRCNKRAGLVAAVCCFGSFFVFDQGIWGGPEAMAGCFLLSAQLLFFHYGSRYAWRFASSAYVGLFCLVKLNRVAHSKSKRGRADV